MKKKNNRNVNIYIYIYTSNIYVPLDPYRNWNSMLAHLRQEFCARESSLFLSLFKKLTTSQAIVYFKHEQKIMWFARKTKAQFFSYF